MLTYSFENIGEESLYEHLYRCIRADILAGRLQAGEKLPSKRSLARQLGISVITVEALMVSWWPKVIVSLCRKRLLRRASREPARPARAAAAHACRAGSA